jgi:large subunit ribosomal protein L10
LDKSQKDNIVRGLQESLGKANGAFLVDYQGLKVEALTKLRHELREANVQFQVIKNRLLLRACEGTDTAVLKDHIAGPSALAITYEDVVKPAKVLTNFSQENETLEIKVGQINGKIVDLPAIKKLAKLPPREILLSHLLFTLSGVPAAFVGVLSEITRKMVTVLDAIKRQKER